LLIDDDHGRRIARYYNVSTLSTLCMLLEFLLSDKISKEEYASLRKRGLGLMLWRSFLGEQMRLTERVSLLVPKKLLDEIESRAAITGDDKSTVMRELCKKACTN